MVWYCIYSRWVKAILLLDQKTHTTSVTHTSWCVAKAELKKWLGVLKRQRGLEIAPCTLLGPQMAMFSHPVRRSPKYWNGNRTWRRTGARTGKASALICVDWKLGIEWDQRRKRTSYNQPSQCPTKSVIGHDQNFALVFAWAGATLEAGRKNFYMSEEESKKWKGRKISFESSQEVNICFPIELSHLQGLSHTLLMVRLPLCPSELLPMFTPLIPSHPLTFFTSFILFSTFWGFLPCSKI